MACPPHRILILSRRIDLNDGISSHLDTLLSGIAAEGHDILMVTGTLSGSHVMPERLARFQQQTRGIRVLEAVSPGKGTSIASLMKFVLAQAREFRPTVVHVHGMSSGILGWMVARAGLSDGLVVTAHVLNDHISWTRIQIQKIFSYLRADAYIAISSEMKDFFHNSLSIPEKKIHTVFNGISRDKYTPASAIERKDAKQSFGISPNTLVVTVPARLDHSKGHRYAIAALRQLAREREVVALFPGTGTDAEEIRRLAHQSPEDERTFRFLGQLPDLVQVFRAADILLLPSHNEGFPLVIAEGMMSGGVPVRTPSAGALDQIDDGTDGFIVPFDDVEAIRKRLEELTDDALRARMSAAAISKASTLFSSDVMIRHTLDVYDIATSRTSHVRRTKC